MSIFKVAKYYLTKLADYPTIETIKPMIKGIIENLKDQNSMLGVLYASNINIQNMQEYIYIHFILNLDNKYTIQNQIEQNKNARDKLIYDSINKMLKRRFPEFIFKVQFNDFAIEKPGFFGKEED